MYISALQHHSNKNLAVSTLFHRKIGCAPLRYYVEFSRHEDSIKAGRQFRPSFSKKKKSVSKMDQKVSEKTNIKRRNRLPRKKIDATKNSRGKLHDITHNKKHQISDRQENFPTQRRSSKKRKAAKSMLNELIVPNKANWEQFFVDVEGSLAD